MEEATNSEKKRKKKNHKLLSADPMFSRIPDEPLQSLTIFFKIYVLFITDSTAVYTGYH